MSLTDTIVEELNLIEPNKTCCRKALLCGLLYSCKLIEDTSIVTVSLYREADALKAVKIVDVSFPSNQPTQIIPCRRGGHKAYTFDFKSKALFGIFLDIDKGRAESISKTVGFRCKECEGNFLRGIFSSCATLCKPQSGYHLEFSIANEPRASLFSDILSRNIATPGKIKRNGRIGLYYKSNAKIADALYLFGATKASFNMTNMSIERDIRNNENRATNCVTRNISLSVEAASKHIEAINYLISIGKLEMLSEELMLTAKLRLEYDSATLTELAMMHNPPISKSGLNGRLTKILAIAREQKRINEEKV